MAGRSAGPPTATDLARSADIDDVRSVGRLSCGFNRNGRRLLTVAGRALENVGPDRRHAAR
eukprot:6451777-Lingulodinium_polyedra.AAC.1